MRVMARYTAFDHRRMLEGPGALNVAVARDTTVILRARCNPRVAMRVVAGQTSQSALSDRMMRWHLKAGFDFRVALNAEAACIIRFAESTLRLDDAKILRLTIMRVVAVRAKHPGRIVIAVVPLLMAREPDRVTAHTIVIRGKPDIGRFFALGMEAAPTMTRLALRVVGGHEFVALDVLVANTTFVRTHGLSSFYLGGPGRTKWRPREGRACQKEEKNESGRSGARVARGLSHETHILLGGRMRRKAVRSSKCSRVVLNREANSLRLGLPLAELHGHCAAGDAASRESSVRIGQGVRPNNHFIMAFEILLAFAPHEAKQA